MRIVWGSASGNGRPIRVRISADITKAFKALRSI